ncbi:hypothetical protein BDV96DRAFT_596487 [Lophiotrema nucula]|uniref:Uncharacterized protein n=1 Tax=Lophiotrema nucula TaxID=690887 RepID=A0A6A5ZGM5_9PLEO|nr:hypothetical protein BDV96DRAFT_596487 [Lophiotrema nucula]
MASQAVLGVGQFELCPSTPVILSIKDLNDPWALGVYTSLVNLKGRTVEEVYTRHGLSQHQQRILQSLAHYLGLEYGHNVSSRASTVSRPARLPWEQNQSFDFSLSLIPTCFNERVPYALMPLSDVSSSLDADSGTSIEGPGRAEALHPSRAGLSHEGERDAAVDTFAAPSAISFDGANPLWAPDAFDATVLSPTTHIAELQFPQYTTLRSPDPKSYSPANDFRRIGSRASYTSSASSAQSARSSKEWSSYDKSNSRRSSAYSKGSSNYEEYVFLADPSRSSTRVTGSRKRGPKDKEKETAMDKLGGRCWRCKLLKKTCTLGMTCGKCPTTNPKSWWQRLGCKRGALYDATPRTLLCPNEDS